jgi:Secretion system C-terminal sorting domain
MKKITLLFALLFVTLFSSAQERRSAPAASHGGDLLIFPNPSDSYVTVNPGTSDVEFRHLRIYNLQGVMVEDRLISRAEGSIVIDLDGYEDGIYVIALTDDNDYNRRSGRVVKRR